MAQNSKVSIRSTTFHLHSFHTSQNDSQQCSTIVYFAKARKGVLIHTHVYKLTWKQFLYHTHWRCLKGLFERGGGMTGQHNNKTFVMRNKRPPQWIRNVKFHSVPCVPDEMQDLVTWYVQVAAVWVCCAHITRAEALSDSLWWIRTVEQTDELEQ